MNIEIDGYIYNLIKDYREGFKKEEFLEKYTDYFKEYDYIVGDIAYGKLRLKGFYKKDNKKCTKINNIDNLDKYLSENCAYECKYFVLEKVEK
jgi:uncharacterized protein YutD